MKRVIVMLLVTGLVGGFVSCVLAQEESVVAEQTQSTPEVVAPPVVDVQKQAIEQASLNTLIGQTWAIYISNQGRHKTSVRNDSLTFVDKTVSSLDLSAKGYSTSNISLAVGDNQEVTWETVMRDADDNTASWRGILKGPGDMVGILSFRSKLGNIDNYEFSTTMPETTTDTKRRR